MLINVPYVFVQGAYIVSPIDIKSQNNELDNVCYRFKHTMLSVKAKDSDFNDNNYDNDNNNNFYS